MSRLRRFRISSPWRPAARRRRDALLLALMLAPLALAEPPPQPGAAGAGGSQASGTAASVQAAATPSITSPRYLPARFAGRAGAYYKHVWGIEQLVVREAESGELLRFSWRVVNPERASILNDKKIEPTLIAPQRGVSLVVPVLDKIGQMRQTSPPEEGRVYWMAFSNKGHLIKRGDRVEVVVGNFRAEGLVVD